MTIRHARWQDSEGLFTGGDWCVLLWLAGWLTVNSVAWCFQSCENSEIRPGAMTDQKRETGPWRLTTCDVIKQQWHQRFEADSGLLSYYWNMNDRHMEFLIFVFLCISRHSRSFHNLITAQKWSRISRYLWTHRSAYLEVSAKFSLQSMTEMLSSTRSSLLHNTQTKGSALPLWCRRTVIILLFALCFHETLPWVRFGGLFKTSTSL